LPNVGNHSKIGHNRFVCAVRKEDSAPVLIRSYQSRAFDNLYEHIKIWEAVRATSAASTFFDPIKIGSKGQEFVDGALRYNNPIEMADIESRTLWPNDERMILSIGTGSAPGRSLDGGLIKLVDQLIRIVSESDETNNRFRAGHHDMIEANRLFRFTVSHGLADIGIEEYQAVNKISTYTETYLNNPDTLRLVEVCIKTMRLGGQRLNISPNGS
jgi:predicted acylesterase/phospholipase RssA